MHACMRSCMRARERRTSTLRRIYAAMVVVDLWRKSAEVAEVAADFPFSHRSCDQDYPEIAPNDADGLVT
jgi:hypothetical protein